jgi:hypothetical protein
VRKRYQGPVVCACEQVNPNSGHPDRTIRYHRNHRQIPYSSTFKQI